MPISVTCDNCAATYTVQDQLAGKKVRCKQCGNVIAVGGGRPAPAPPPSAPSASKPAARPAPKVEARPEPGIGAENDLEMTPEQYAALMGMPPAGASRAGGSRAGGPRASRAQGSAAGRPAPLHGVERRSSMKATGTDGYKLEGEADDVPAAGFWEKYDQRVAPREIWTGLLVIVHFAVAVGALVRVLLNDAVRKADVMPFVLTRAGMIFVGCFLVAAPVVMGAVYGTSKIFDRRLPHLNYAKAAGVASVLFIFFFATLLLIPLPGSNITFLTPDVAMVVRLAAVAAFGATLIYAFGLGVLTGPTTLLMCLMAFGIILSSAGPTFDELRGIGERPEVLAHAPKPEEQRQVVQAPTTGPTESDIKANRVRNRLTELANQIELQPREKLQSDLAAIERDAAELKDHPRAADLPKLIEEAQARIARAAPETPDPSIFEPMPPGDAFASDASLTPSLEAEISFGPFRIRPPKEALLDLRTPEIGSRRLVWVHGEPDANGVFAAPPDPDRPRLSISIAYRQNAQQMRPWLVSKPFQVQRAREQNLYTVDLGGATVTTGNINQVPVTRVTTADAQGKQTVRYVAAEQDQWVTIEITGAPAGDRVAALFEASARSARRANPTELRIDPLSPDRLVKRLSDSPDAAVALLKKQREAAEAVVLPLLRSPDARLKESALLVLSEAGTAKSLEAVKEHVATENSRVSEAARAAWRHIDPAAADAVAFAVLDLEGAPSLAKQRLALSALAKAKPDNRRLRVAPLLESILLGKAENAIQLYDAAADAIAVWAAPNSAVNIANVLKSPNTPEAQRQPIIRALGRIKDPRTLPQLTKWVLLETQLIEEAFVTFGPAAEDEALFMLKEREPAARISAARILQEIGTKKSLYGLQVASKDPRDPAAAEAAAKAWEVVRQRAANSLGKQEGVPSRP